MQPSPDRVERLLTAALVMTTLALFVTTMIGWGWLPV